MRERGLLRAALESPKTTSRKKAARDDSVASSGVVSRAGSKAGSGNSSAVNSTNNSPLGSRNGSRVGSRQGTDDEFEDESDAPDSIDGVLSDWGDADEALPEEWQSAINERISGILERNKKNPDAREQNLRWYLGIAQNHYAAEEVAPYGGGLVRQLLRFIKSEETETETILALKCLAVTVLTDTSGSEDYLDLCVKPLQSNSIGASTSEMVQAEAIHTLAMVVFCGVSDGDDEALEEAMTYFLGIVESDGASINAPDSAMLVAAATDAYAFLATTPDELEDISEDAVAAFAEQLNSNSAVVQIAAGRAIAVFYEASWAPPGSEEDLPLDPDTGEAPKLVQSYSAYRATPRLLEQLRDLNKLSAKSVSKRDRRALHEAISTVIREIENPGTGPGSTVSEGWKSNRDGEKTAPSAHMRIRVSRAGHTLTVDSWWLLARLNAFRRCLGSGFMEHYQHNSNVTEALEPGMESRPSDAEARAAQRHAWKSDKLADQGRAPRRR